MTGGLRTDGLFLFGTLLLSGLLGLGWNLTGGERSAWAPRSVNALASDVSDIGLTELRRRIDDKTTIILDARSQREFKEGHLLGAVNIPWNTPVAELETRILQLLSDPRDTIVVYCASVMCEDADRLANRLGEVGKPIRIYRGGWEEWQANP